MPALYILGNLIIPTVLLIWAARRRNRSEHWAWWGLTGFGWIVFFYILANKPKELMARYEVVSSSPFRAEGAGTHEVLVCAKCGVPLQSSPSDVQQNVLHRILFGLLGTAVLQVAAGWQHTCPNCGVIPRDGLPSRAVAKMGLVQIGLFILICIVAGFLLMLADSKKGR